MNKKYSWYKISADGGKSQTKQYLTEEEANEEEQMGYIVKMVDALDSNSLYFVAI